MKKLTITELQKIIASPYYCINIHPMLSTEHDPLVSKELWIKAATREIKEIGEPKFLEHLLEVLEGDYV